MADISIVGRGYKPLFYARAPSNTQHCWWYPINQLSSGLGAAWVVCGWFIDFFYARIHEFPVGVILTWQPGDVLLQKWFERRVFSILNTTAFWNNIRGSDSLNRQNQWECGHHLWQKKSLWCLHKWLLQVIWVRQKRTGNSNLSGKHRYNPHTLW